MRRFRYSYGISGRSAEEVAAPIHRLAGLGYDAVELGAELSPADAGKVRDLVEDAGLTVSSICPSFTAERDLSHPDPQVRENAVCYLREVADLAHAVRAPMFIVAPTAFLRSRPLASEDEEWGWAVESIKAAGEYAALLGVGLTLECWNRYGTFLLNRLDQASRMWRETGLPNGGVLADTYHMNIEERSLPEAIRVTGTLINHVHLSDSNRAAPGLGHVDYHLRARPAGRRTLRRRASRKSRRPGKLPYGAGHPVRQAPRVPARRSLTRPTQTSLRADRAARRG